jgi:hypothetical protein
MTSLSPDEIAARVTGLRAGPWQGPTERALQKLAPPYGLNEELIASEAPIALPTLAIGPVARTRERELKEPLRSHFTHGAITDPDEIILRDELDQALLQAQLYELAAHAGYLPVDAIRIPARSLLAGLLWSEAARRFLATYVYPAVPMLAQRVEVQGLQAVRAPPPTQRPQDSVRFAAFLAHMAQFYGDPRIRCWTSFMDDFIKEPNEVARFIDYIRQPELPPTRRAEAMIEGMLLFLDSLSSAFALLDKNQYACFGLPHAYWLQKFFGQLFTGSSDPFDPARRAMFNWAGLFSEHLSKHMSGDQPELADYAVSKLRTDIALLGEIFCAVKVAVSEAKPPVSDGA